MFNTIQQIILRSFADIISFNLRNYAEITINYSPQRQKIELAYEISLIDENLGELHNRLASKCFIFKLWGGILNYGLYN